MIKERVKRFFCRVILKPRWLITSLLISTYCLFYDHNKVTFYQSSFTETGEQFKFVREMHSPVQIRDESEWSQRNVEICNTVSNIAYLKSHKTGSTAVQAMLFRYGIKNNLTFALPKSEHFSFVTPFSRKMVYPQSGIDKVTFNIFAVHCIWNMGEIELLMPNNTIYIASVREPTEIFVSLFDFFNFEQKSKMSFTEFVQNVSDCRAVMKTFHGYHQLLQDFGLSTTRFNNSEAVQRLIENADKYFHLVLVTERMEESLILLRHLLCWTHEEVAIFNVNARQEKFKSTMSNETKAILQQRQYHDFLLYNHFRNKIENLIEDFGEQRMKEEITELRKATDRIKAKCHLVEKKSEMLTGIKELWSHKVMGLDLSSEAVSEECRLLAFSENSLKEYARKKQNQRFNLTLRLGPT